MSPKRKSFSRIIKSLFTGKKKFGSDPAAMSTEEILALMRHESHRIEKALYNGIIETKRHIYEAKRDRLASLHKLLEERGVPRDEPTVQWSRWIHDSFDRLDEAVSEASSQPREAIDLAKAGPFLDMLKSRRSVRVWASEQPDSAVFRELADRMIDAARWAPNSGNRQALRFRIMTDEREKRLLCRLKEEHCISAPMLIFVGSDSRIYGALGEEERCLYIDSGAAIMQMILLAHDCGFGCCWNHFADDLVGSRELNIEKYAAFSKALGIPDYIAPVAILAVGAAAFIPPVPARMDAGSYMLRGVRQENDSDGSGD